MRIAVLLVVLLLTALPAAAQRLPAGATPEHYTLSFAPDLTAATFRATAAIRVRLSSASTTITMHAAELTFDEVSIETAAGRQVAAVATNEAAQTVTFTVGTALAAGEATVRIAYRGILNDKLRGFYLSQANGRAYAVSQMEATDARRAFPGFDEPAYKATFDISITAPAGDTAISNGRVVSDTPGPLPGTHTVTFATTPKMSTYLVALLVGDFVCREGRADDTPIRVCATPDKLELTAFALEAAQFELAWFNQYFGIPYPYDKLDIIGVPDFAAGAMENAGAITFRERLLLVDEASASIGVRKAVASVIAHELAHQWFGNLVTMKWWDDIWLNEGFATWAANKPLAAWKPEWRMELNAAAETQTALALDSLRATRAIRTKVETPAEINEVFDPIAYEKTSGVIGMIEAYVGPEKFRESVSAYLTRYALGNAAGEDFWNEVTRVTEKPVNRIMRSFVDQPGAPLLTVRTSCASGNTRVTVSQQRFDGGSGAASRGLRPRRDVDAAGVRQDRQQRHDVRGGDGGVADLHGAGLRHAVRQRRRPRLLLHRVRAGGRRGPGHAHAAAHLRRTDQPARRRMAARARRPPRHRHLPRSRGGLRQRPDARRRRRTRRARRLRRRHRGRRGPASGLRRLAAHDLRPSADGARRTTRKPAIRTTRSACAARSSACSAGRLGMTPCAPVRARWR